MKDYIKPTFTLASLFPVALAAGSDCAVNSVDVKDMLENGFKLPYVETAFGMNEACDTKYDIDMYCKFTSAEAGALKILGS